MGEGWGHLINNGKKECAPMPNNTKLRNNAQSSSPPRAVPGSDCARSPRPHI